MDDLNLQQAMRIAAEARQKFAAAASLINDGHNMVKALNAAGYRVSQMQEILAQLDAAQNATERAVSAIDRLRG